MSTVDDLVRKEITARVLAEHLKSGLPISNLRVYQEIEYRCQIAQEIRSEIDQEIINDLLNVSGLS